MDLEPDRRSVVGWLSKLLNSIKKWFASPTLPLDIEEKQPVQPWTITHGFFVQMGGFMLSKNRRPIQTLEYKSETVQCIHELIANREIDPPTITKAEIDDRSKGDFISKSFVVLQTTWFIAQCIARWSVKIPVSQLEIVTLGFAVLNGITYALWWDKPQSVRVPVYLEWRLPNNSNVEAADRKKANTSAAVLGLSLTDNRDDAKYELPGDSELESPTNSNVEAPGPKKAYTDTSAALGSFLPDNGDNARHETQGDSELEKTSSPVQATDQPFSEETTDSTDSFLGFVAGLFLVLLTFAPLIPLAKMLQIEKFKRKVSKGNLRVPVFHADTMGFETTTVFTPSMAIATIFGCVHLIPAWLPLLEFPTRKDMWLWRISACLITGLPVALGLSMYGASG